MADGGVGGTDDVVDWNAVPLGIRRTCAISGLAKNVVTGQRDTSGLIDEKDLWKASSDQTSSGSSSCSDEDNPCMDFDDYLKKRAVCRQWEEEEPVDEDTQGSVEDVARELSVSLGDVDELEESEVLQPERLEELKGPKVHEDRGNLLLKDGESLTGSQSEEVRGPGRSEGLFGKRPESPQSADGLEVLTRQRKREDDRLSPDKVEDDRLSPDKVEDDRLSPDKVEDGQTFRGPERSETADGLQEDGLSRLDALQSLIQPNEGLSDTGLEISSVDVIHSEKVDPPLDNGESQDSGSAFVSVVRDIEKCLVNKEDNLELNRRGIIEIPHELLQLRHLKNLYLEGNKLRYLPENFFLHFPALSWLDLRNNKLKYLPGRIWENSVLKNLLLEGNRFEVLPPELGLLPNLRGLNIRKNPLVDPPENVLKLGLPGVMQYLRQQVCVYNEAGKSRLLSVTNKVSSKSSSKSSKFRNSKSLVSNPSSNTRRLIPYEMGTDYKGPSKEKLMERSIEEERTAALKLRHEQIDAVIQHIKSEVSLKSWREKARREQMEMMMRGGKSQSVKDVAMEAPYDTDENFLVMMSRVQLQNMEYFKNSKRFPQPMPGYIDSTRRKREKDLERQIWAHLHQLEESTENGTIDLQQAAAQLREVGWLDKSVFAVDFKILLLKLICASTINVGNYISGLETSVSWRANDDFLQLHHEPVKDIIRKIKRSFVQFENHIRGHCISQSHVTSFMKCQIDRNISLVVFNGLVVHCFLWTELTTLHLM